MTCVEICKAKSKYVFFSRRKRSKYVEWPSNHELCASRKKAQNHERKDKASGNPIGRASVSWHAGARFPTGPRRPHGHAHVTCDAYFSFISFSLREPSHQTKAAATGTSDAAVLNQKLVWYCESEHACFVLFFFSIFFPPCPVNGSGYHSFYFFFRFLPLLSTMCKFS